MYMLLVVHVINIIDFNYLNFLKKKKFILDNTVLLLYSDIEILLAHIDFYSQ